MRYKVGEGSLDKLNSYWKYPEMKLNWPSVFVLPVWLQVWWQIFSDDFKMFVRTVGHGDKIIGIAPLMVKDSTAFFIGNTDVCDYLDFITTPGAETEFFNVLLDDMEDNGIKQLDLKHVRNDATVFTSLKTIAAERGYKITESQEDVSLEMELPADWEKYLASLSTKQRHEIRRKLRRLSETGEVGYHFVEDGMAIATAMSTFFKMFVESRQDKAEFMTEQMKAFFRLLAEALAGAGLLKLGVLTLDTRPTAEIMCFDYNDCIYLYNSGYDPDYVSLSAGLLSKVMAIKDSIEKGKKRFDFLKGVETYKYHLGGQEVPLYRCQIKIK